MKLKKNFYTFEIWKLYENSFLFHFFYKTVFFLLKKMLLGYESFIINFFNILQFLKY